MPGNQRKRADEDDHSPGKGDISHGTQALRTEFTRHINAVLAGDPDIGHRLPFPTDT